MQYQNSKIMVVPGAEPYWAIKVLIQHIFLAPSFGRYQQETQQISPDSVGSLGEKLISPALRDRIGLRPPQTASSEVRSYDRGVGAI